MAYALITGASKGIGKAIAIELAKRKYNLILVARSEQLLQELANEMQLSYKVEVQYLAIDLSQPDAAMQVAGFVKQKNIALNVLVNNAGYGLWGKFEKIELAKQVNMIRLNNESLVSLTYCLLPFLKEQNEAYILNVASTTAYQAIPFMSVYAASKAFVVSFSRGLASELRGTGVSVSCLSPGSTNTFFMEVAGMNSKKLVDLSNKVAMSAEEVAAAGVAAMFNKKTEFIPGFSNKLTAYANNFLPKRLIELIAGNIYRV
ncbi:MAG: short-chain dehydrogenase [Bacteroidota bacterium]|nr:short-chain dehydrogenase [Bacteroidota bacterium]